MRGGTILRKRKTDKLNGQNFDIIKSSAVMWTVSPLTDARRTTRQRWTWSNRPSSQVVRCVLLINEIKMVIGFARAPVAWSIVANHLHWCAPSIQSHDDDVKRTRMDTDGQMHSQRRHNVKRRVFHFYFIFDFMRSEQKQKSTRKSVTTSIWRN